MRNIVKSILQTNYQEHFVSVGLFTSLYSQSLYQLDSHHFVIIFKLYYFFKYFIEFWNIQKEIFTQPIVSSRGQYLLKVFTSTATTYTYTNIYEIFNVVDTPIGLVSFSESSNSTYDRIDQNHRPSTMNFTIIISGSNLNANVVKRVELMIFLDYTIDKVTLDKFQTYAYINVYTPVGASVINTYGSLEFRQVQPLLESSSYRQRFNYPPYYSLQGQLLIDTLDINNENFNRNESVYYNYENHVQQPTTTAQTQQMQINCYTTISRYSKVNYTAGILEAAKFSWMQYFSIFLIFWKLGTTLLVFVVENKVFETTWISTLPTEKLHKLKQD